MEHQPPHRVHPIFQEILCRWDMHDWEVTWAGKFTWYKCAYCPAERCE